MNRVYLSGLPYETTISSLKDWIAANCDLAPDSISSIQLPTYHDSGRARGYAFLEFTTEEFAKQCMEKGHKKDFDGRFVAIEKAKEPAEDSSNSKRKMIDAASISEKTTTLFIKNLPYETEEEKVKVVFDKILASSKDKVKSVRLARWNNTKRLKGFGYVEFGSNEALKIVVQYSSKKEIKLDGRILEIDVEENSQPKKSFKDSEGRNYYKTEGRPEVRARDNFSSTDRRGTKRHRKDL